METRKENEHYKEGENFLKGGGDGKVKSGGGGLRCID